MVKNDLLSIYNIYYSLVCIYNVGVYENNRRYDSACKYTYNEIFDDIYNNVGIMWVHGTRNIGMSIKS